MKELSSSNPEKIVCGKCILHPTQEEWALIKELGPKEEAIIGTEDKLIAGPDDIRIKKGEFIPKPTSKDEILNWNNEEWKPVYAHCGWHQAEIIWKNSKGVYLMPTEIESRGM